MSGRGRGTLWLSAGALVLAAAVVVVLVFVSRGGGDDGGSTGTGTGTSATRLVGVTEVLAELEGVDQEGDRLGSATAPVTISEFADLQCPACAQAARDLVPRVVDDLVRPGTAALRFRNFAFLGPDSAGGALGAAAAAEQSRVWPFVEILFRNQGAENSGWLTDGLQREVAEAVPGLDGGEWALARDGQAATEAVEASFEEGRRAGVTSTPTFVVTGPRGTRLVSGAVAYDQIEAAVEAVR